MANVFTAEEFARNLAAGKLKQPLLRAGMTKTHNDASKIWFAAGGCGTWIALPLSLIEKVNFLQNVKCEDHEHPLVLIQFKEPDASNEAAQVFAELARSPVPPPTFSTSGPESYTALPPEGGVPAIPDSMSRRAPPGTNSPPVLGPLVCITWRQVCGWSTLYIRDLNVSIPIYTCWYVCSGWGLPVAQQ
jgi:hypothetical protein